MNGDGQGRTQEQLGLPFHPFLYTIDQVAGLLSMTEANLKERHLYYVGRTTRRATVKLLKAVNIAEETAAPVWRISETELIRWMRACGIILHRRKPSL